MAKWITNEDFAALSPINVFGKEHAFKQETKSAFFNKHILFRRKANVPVFAKAILRISADDYYKLYINGKFVCMGPSPSYPGHYCYNEIDITCMLLHGENIFAAHTYYMGLRNRVFVSGDNLHGFYFELCLDGELFLCSDESWKVSYHTGYAENGSYGYETGFLESYDSSAAEADFEKADFNDSKWKYAVENKNFASTHKLEKKAVLLDVYRIKPKTVELRGENDIFIDIGRELCGYLEYTAKGEKGSEIIIYSGEELNDDGSVRFDLRCNCRFEEKHILSGGADTLSQYDYKGFRYVRLHLPHGCEIDIDSVRIIVRHYPYDEKADISSDDKRLSEILRLCADTVKYGVQEVCVDCPTREKGQYLGDSGFIALSYAALTGSAEVLEKVLVDFADSAFICPGLMAVSTSSFNQEIADYSLMYPFFAYSCYKINNDKAFLSSIYPVLYGLMKYFSSFVKDGILCDVTEKWNLVDWPANLRDGYDFDLQNPPIAGSHNVIAAYYIGAAIYFEEIRRILGMAPLYDIAEMKKAFTEKFFDAESGLFKDTPESRHHSIHSNVLPLLFDIGINPETKRKIIAMISEKRLRSVNYFAFFILLALEKENEYDLMRKLICDEGSWSNMLAEGATTCFEAWGKTQKWNTSLFHPWMSYPVIFSDKIK